VKFIDMLHRRPKPVKYTPVFSGKTVDGGRLVLYKSVEDESDLYIRRPDGQFSGLSPGAIVVMEFDSVSAKLALSIRSPEWTGTARGSKADLIKEEALR
jgi:hypothetical protein